MDDLREARHVTIGIRRSPEDVYAFVADARNLPRWATGLGAAIQNVDGDWVAEGPLGRIKVRFCAPNQLGVLDHDVTLPSGETVHNPLRVIKNGSGSELVFTLFRPPEMSVEKLDDDVAWVRKDLGILKDLLEAGPHAT